MGKRLEERVMLVLMVLSTVLVVGSLLVLLLTVLARGLPAVNLQMLTQTPQGGYYLGEEGGILNAILGSLMLAGGATVASSLIGLGVVFYLHLFARSPRLVRWIRFSLDVLWGVPSIVYGAFGFTVMLLVGLRTSLLGGIMVLTLLELPIVVRAMGEVMAMVPAELKEASYALGATRLQTALTVIVRQTAPGLLTAMLLAFGRGIGDAASVLFTAGYTDQMPTSLLRPVASLPLAVFFQLSVPFPQVQQRAYASALVLIVLVLAISLFSRWLSGRMSRHVLR